MDLINIILVLILVCDLIFVYLTLTHSKHKNRITIFYIINVTAIAFWVLGIVLFRASTQDIIVPITKYIYTIASLVVSSFYYFTLVFPNSDKKYLNQIVTVLILNFFIIYLTIFTGFIIKDAQVRNIGENVFFVGNLYGLYVIYTIYFLSSSILRLFLKSYYSLNIIVKKQLLYLAICYGISALIALITNLLMPWFGISQYNWIGTSSSFFMIIGFMLVIAKYNFFSIKIIAAEIFIFALWIFTVIKTFLPSSLDNNLSRFSFFILIIIVGLLLIRSVKNEVAQREKLKELDELKSELISLATHHISTPLTAVKGYVSLIQEGHYGKVPAEMEETLVIIDRSTTNMANIVRDFLDVSRIDNNQVQYNFVEQDIVLILKEIVSDQKFNAEKKSLSVVLNSHVESYIYSVDEDKFKQAISNIIENAIRHTKQGSITVEFSVKENTPIIKIIDSSDRKFPVISKKLSQKFTKTGKESEVNVISTGLGIYVAKQIIEVHKGNLSIDTEIDSTVFLVTLNRG